MALSLREFFYGCVISQYTELFRYIDEHLITQAENHANNNPYILADFLWANMNSYEKNHINNYMDDFLSEHKENEPKKNESKLRHIRYVDLSKKNLPNLLRILDRCRLNSRSYINLSDYATENSLKERILNFSPYDQCVMKKKLYMCSIVINEILHRKGFWDNFLEFDDRDNFIAFCIFGGVIFCQDIMDGNYRSITMLIEKKTYLPIYDIIHETLSFS